MSPEPDDLTPLQRGKRPSPNEMASRKELSLSRVGRWGRLRSWATVAVAVLALFVCSQLLRHIL
jgi:hypothetical protein